MNNIKQVRVDINAVISAQRDPSIQCNSRRLRIGRERQEGEKKKAERKKEKSTLLHSLLHSSGKVGVSRLVLPAVKRCVT